MKSAPPHPSTPTYPEITPAQWAVLVALTDQRCTNLLAAADFISDLSDERKAFLTQAKPETLEFLRDLREDEVKGLQAYLLLRSTSSYLAWGIGVLTAACVAALTIWDKLPFGKGVK